MKKIVLAIIASALVLATAACGTAEKTEETTKGTGGKVTQVLYDTPQEEDTTEEAIEYLKTKIPLFAKYLETRRSIPLTFETEVTTPDTHEFTGIYIRDDKSIAVSAVDDFGNEFRMIYMDETVYFVNDEDKTIYSYESSEEGIKNVVESYRLKIKLSDAESNSYVDDFDYYKDVLYKHEIIYSDRANPSHYFYDENTEELKYIVSGENETKVLALENTVKEEMFELPAGYKKADMQEYVDKVRAEQAAEDNAATSAAETQSAE